MGHRAKVSSDEITGFLDQGTAVTGELRFSGTLRIDGDFHGSISTDDVLTVGEHADVHADIQAGEVEIHGRVSGNIEATRKIEGEERKAMEQFAATWSNGHRKPRKRKRKSP